MTVTDRELVAQVGALYERSWAQLEATVYADKREQAEARGDLVTKRVLTSSSWLAANFSQVPLVILPFVRNDPDGSGIYPAVWNLMLAARAQGVGTTLTTVLHHFAADEVGELLGILTQMVTNRIQNILARINVHTRPRTLVEGETR